MINKLLLTFVLLVFSRTALADEDCNVALEHGLIITENEIRIVDGTQTRVQINFDKHIFIEGRWIELSAEDSKVLKAYSQGLRSTVPELVSLATDGVNLGLTAIEQVVKGISDKEPDVLQNQLEYVERAIMDKFKKGDDFYFIAPQSLSRLDDFFKNEISKKIHAAVHGSIGAILVTLGEVFQSDEGNIETRFSDMNNRMDIISNEIDKSLQAKAAKLNDKAKEYCGCLQSLDTTETELQQLIPQLTKYDLVTVKP